MIERAREGAMLELGGGDDALFFPTAQFSRVTLVDRMMGRKVL